jgi:hypothetical protein
MKNVRLPPDAAWSTGKVTLGSRGLTTMMMLRMEAYSKIPVTNIKPTLRRSL